MLIHSCFFCFHLIICKCIGCHCYDRYCFCICSVHISNRFRSSQSVHNRHHHIHKNRIICPNRRFFKAFHRFFSIFRLCNHGTFICHNKLRNFHIQLIIFYKQNMQSLKRYRSFFFFFHSVSLGINLKRNPNYKCSSDACFTFKLNCSTHFFHKTFCDWHSKSCSIIFRTASCIFLCKRLKNHFLKFSAHTDSGVLTDKFNHRHTLLIIRDFSVLNTNTSIILIVFHRITQNIHPYPFHMCRTANQIPMGYFLFFLNQLNISLLCQQLNYCQYLF